MVFDAWDSVPGPNGFQRHAVANIVDECVVIERYLHIAEMASRRKAFPREFGLMVRPLRKSFAEWLAGLPAVIGPALAIETAAVLDDVPPPRVHRTLRLIETGEPAAVTHRTTAAIEQRLKIAE